MSVSMVGPLSMLGLSLVMPAFAVARLYLDDTVRSAQKRTSPPNQPEFEFPF